MSDFDKTIGILYAGELGSAVGALLQSRGYRVVTTHGTRGPRTIQRCAETGLIALDSLAEVVRQADVLISLVPPAAALDIAKQYADLAAIAPKRAIYVDANSIGPESVVAIGNRLSATGIDFVDAAINGLAKNLRESGTFFLSGPRAGEIAGLFGDATRVRLLGNTPGRASAMKMLLGGLSKGVCALFLELARVAERNGMLPEMLEAIRSIYPGIHALADRMLPTYALHAERRVTEMSELAATARAAGVEPCAIDAILKIHESLASIPLGDNPTMPQLIQKVEASANRIDC